MHKITFISTVHKEIGKCNAIELSEIIEKLNPEVIFLEAIDETYSKYERNLFSSFGIFHKKLEISAIQKHSNNSNFEYVPVLDKGLSDSFERKYEIVCEIKELQILIDNFNLQAEKHGFTFLNSDESVALEEEMRQLEEILLNEHVIVKLVNEDIDTYENSMIRNIYSYCMNNKFKSAIFMCGVAHRKSIIEKIEKSIVNEKLKLNWVIFEN